ncbi:MAG: TPM domain-containing protein [Candidatus Hydrogenedentes bacterium]|nr:TPM domain-containing protein [Candidatus Hydrogenedentota bacterium]
MPRFLHKILLPALLLGVAHAAAAQPIDLQPPGDRDFILDQAYVLQPQDAEQIKTLCDKLLTENAIPIVVVTINSMADYGTRNSSIEAFATALFNQWGIGHPTVNGESWNRGILLLVSMKDRKARIELGADWDPHYDGVCKRIMDEQIIPHFKRGGFSPGILAGVQSLDNMARGIAMPKGAKAQGAQGKDGTFEQVDLPPPVEPAWLKPAIVIAVILFIFTIVSMIRRGSGGWAWLFWGAVFGLIGMILYNMLASSRHSGGGGFSGGSFGGGFSGGGGASGSW